MPAASQLQVLDVIWLTAGLSCDGDTVSITAATQPSLEDLILGALPGVPKLRLHNPVLAYANGDDFMQALYDAADGKMKPFALVVEGSIPNETKAAETGGVWAAFGIDKTTGQPIPTCDWIDRLVAKASAVVAAGTCAAYGGIHAMIGNPTDCCGLADYLDWGKKLPAGVPLICVPGCPVQPDNFMETLLYLLCHLAGNAPAIPLDDKLRPKWLFENTVHEGCDRAGYYEQADFATLTGDRVGDHLGYSSRKCLVKLGCWGPVVQCNVGKRGWMAGIGGCASVGGICIGCTMPGFPDKFMQPSFMDEPPGAKLSTEAISTYGRAIRKLRQITQMSANAVPPGRSR